MKFTTLLALATLTGACGGSEPAKPKAPPPEPAPPPAAPVVPDAHTALFKALPARPTAEQAKIDLGHQLYFDTRLSANGKISCATCHDPAKGGDDGEPTSPGHHGGRGVRNSPTSLNAALQFVQFWDGRSLDVEDQAKGPMLNSDEMGLKDAAEVEKILSSVPGYKTAFAAAFPGASPAITFDNFAAAVGAYERQLVTPGRFDNYLGGDASALTDAEKKGLDTFIATGCTACHNGPLLGGNSYQKLGAVVAYDTTDQGRKAVTGQESDAFMFKVPMLRNIAQTAPYFHNGKVATLEEAVTLMGKHQLGKDLPPADVAGIVTFLGALDGVVDPKLAAAPTLP